MSRGNCRQKDTVTRRLWILDYNGRLGNRLKLLTHVAASARENRLGVSNPAFWKYRKGFAAWKNNCTNFFPGHSPLRVPARAERLERGILLAMVRAATAGGVPGCGWLRCPDDRKIALEGTEFVQTLRNGPAHLFLWGYNFFAPAAVLAHGPDLRQLFRPARPVPKSGRFTLALHIRRGDYRDFDGGRYFFGWDQYREWIRQALELWRERNPVCRVYSDEEARRELRGEPGVEFADGDLFGDLFGMAACDVILGPPSSFSDWAAWYGAADRLRLTETRQRLTREMVTKVEIP